MDCPARLHGLHELIFARPSVHGRHGTYFDDRPRRLAVTVTAGRAPRGVTNDRGALNFLFLWFE